MQRELPIRDLYGTAVYSVRLGTPRAQIIHLHHDSNIPSGPQSPHRLPRFQVALVSIDSNSRRGSLKIDISVDYKAR